MKKMINVVGIGPGSEDYMIPAAVRTIKDSDIIVGGRRNIQEVDTKGKETFVITSKLSDAVDYIRKNMRDKVISVVVSGDTGFYSMLSYLSKHFDRESINVVPGVSSMQYMFARIGDTWHDAYISSLHAREDDIIEPLKKRGKVGLLTDKKWNPSSIACHLCENGMGDATIYIGENLSYENERITVKKASEIDPQSEYEMCVVVIRYEGQ